MLEYKKDCSVIIKIIRGIFMKKSVQCKIITDYITKIIDNMCQRLPLWQDKLSDLLRAELS